MRYATNDVHRQLLNNDRLAPQTLKPPEISHAKVVLVPLVLVLLHSPASSAAEQTNAAPARSTTLQECFDLALKYNLDLQIERINPGLGSWTWISPGPATIPRSPRPRYMPTAWAVAGSIRRPIADPWLEVGIRHLQFWYLGLAPFGLAYNLSGNAGETYGTIGGSPTDQTRGSAGVSLTQPLLKNFLIDTTRYNIRVAKNRVKYSDLHLRQQIMSILTAVEQATTS